jgi:hypothetical protein
MSEFYERWGRPPKHPPINCVNRKYWIIFLCICIDKARTGMWN